MKTNIGFIIIATMLIYCDNKSSMTGFNQEIHPIMGTWELISGTTIEKGDIVFVDYTKDQESIKIINDTHFSFLRHDLNKGKDSSAIFVAGGGSYTIVDNKYTEMLEYCNYREWENNKFEFTVTIRNDTLIQSGIEKIDSLGINRMIIEKYVKFRN